MTIDQNQSKVLEVMGSEALVSGKGWFTFDRLAGAVPDVGTLLKGVSSLVRLGLVEHVCRERVVAGTTIHGSPVPVVRQHSRFRLTSKGYDAYDFGYVIA